MKRAKRIFLTITCLSTLLFGSVLSVSAYWTNIIVANLPPMGGQIYPTNEPTKQTDSKTFSTFGNSVQNLLTPHCRLTTTDYVERSDWTPIRDRETISNQTNRGIKGYKYRNIVGSNLAEPSFTRVEYQFDRY